MKACYTVKSHLTRPQTLTAVKVSKEQPPQPCAFDTPLRASTVPGLFGKAGLDTGLNTGCARAQAKTSAATF